LNPAALVLETRLTRLVSAQGKRGLTVPADAADVLLGMPCLDAPQERYSDKVDAGGWLAKRFSRGDLRRVFSAEHTGLLQRDQREALEDRFKAKMQHPWYENLLSATPTLEMGVDIGDLSSVLLCSVPPNQASYLQRIGRAGRRDGNAFTTTLADGASPHDLYFFEDTNEMLQGEVVPPGIFLKAAEVLRRQMFAFCLDDWVGSGIPDTALPDKTQDALNARDSLDQTRFPFTFLDYILEHEARLLQGFKDMLGADIDERVASRLQGFMQGTEEDDALRIRLNKLLEELAKERKSHRDRGEQIKKQIKVLKALPQDEATKNDVDHLERERQKTIELVKEINQRELLNTLTDAGLILNYAFPEAGVELKSLLWRKKGSDDPDNAAAYISLPAERYERPAQSALSEFAVSELLTKGLGKSPVEVLAAADYLAVFENEEIVRAIRPDYALLAKLDLRGVIITAPGDEVDFVSRFFAPKFGISEDPVTGSAHCTLAPYWVSKIGKTIMNARQISKRGGNLTCEIKADRVVLSGQAVTFMRAEISV